MKKFKDLQFKPHYISKYIQEIADKAIINFENGYGVSVLKGIWFYSDGIDTYQVNLLKDNRETFWHHWTDIDEKHTMYATINQVDDIMKYVQELK